MIRNYKNTTDEVICDKASPEEEPTLKVSPPSIIFSGKLTDDLHSCKVTFVNEAGSYIPSVHSLASKLLCL